MTTDERTRIQARTAETAESLRSIVVDLDGFLACPADERARRWRQFDRAAKFQLVALMCERRFGDWQPDEVAQWIARYDAKWEAADPASDLPIPPAVEICALAQERSADAQRAEDWAGAAQLTRVRVNILRGARLTWNLGDLLVQSVNHPGEVYAVSRRGCTCPNGRKGKSACWHVALYDLLRDMQDEAAETAQQAADRAAAADLARRIGAARCARYSRAA